jgi:flagellar biosynthesis component FlhA
VSFFEHILGNLRGSGIIYLVCIAAIVGALKYLDDHPQPKKFTLLGAGLILVAGIGGGLLQAILFQVVVGTTTPTFTSTPSTSMDQVKANLDQIKRRSDALATWGYISGTLGFLCGLAHAAGIASFVYAVFVDKLDLKAKRTKKPKPTRRVADDEDEDEDDRPRRKRAARDDGDDDEDEDEDERPRRKPRRD